MDLALISFDEPAEVRTFEKGRFEVYRVGPMTLGRATYVTFTSSSAVRFFLEAGGRVPDEARVVSIGPVTSETAGGRGLTVDSEARKHDIDGLVDAILEDAAR